MKPNTEQNSVAQVLAFAGIVQDVESVKEESKDGLNNSFLGRRWGNQKPTANLRRLLEKLLEPQSAPRFQIPEALSLLSFCSLLAWCIPHHEAWFDEAQAWLIARDSSLRDLVVHRLHYEGSPALWHVLLWCESRLHVSFMGMHVIAGCIASLGMLVWLRFNRLPRIISLLLPLTFFLQYQYAVVARSYTLCPLLAFGLMALYQDRKSSAFWFCVGAGLLANCSLHMAAMSAGLVLLYVNGRIPVWTENWRHERIHLVSPAIVLAVLFAVSAATAMPTSDGSSTTANPIVSSIRKMVSGKTQPNTTKVQTADWVSSADKQLQAPQQGPIATRAWYLIHAEPGAPPRAILFAGIAKHLLILLTAITVPISTSNGIAIAFLALLVVNLARTQLLISLVPYIFIQACNVLIAGEAHHLGLLWIALMCGVWAVSLRPMPAFGIWRWLRLTLFGATLLVVILQVGWSLHALRSDVDHPYASSVATADFLKDLPNGTAVAAFDDDSVTVNAYLNRSPYFNQKVDYWPFSRTADPGVTFDETMAMRPDVVVLKMSAPDSPITDQWVILNPPGTVFMLQAPLRVVLAKNYRETHRFCGQRFFRNASESTDCRLIFEAVAKGSAAE